jgi:acylphosphatase
MLTRRYVVTGRVRGVFFRASTRIEAQRLGLRGWVRNLPDGRVEALVSGEPEALAALERWLAVGPPHARVTQVQAVDEALQGFTDFVVA